ncbi:tetratricopeptide repeat-containing protein EMW1 PWA37_002962 [Arxiozyma heterogenica]|uniref:tetratricopeptide repeat-containing protein EMW1 n=1 Tax=Arxiozyma heterogenica TaxID=278026 RepID=UPI002EFDC9C1
MDILLHCHLLLASNPNILNDISNTGEIPQNAELSSYILNGESYKVINHIVDTKINSPDTKIDLSSCGDDIKQISDTIRNHLIDIFPSNDRSLDLPLLFAIALLQTFIQNNYTGPSAPLDDSFISKLFVTNEQFDAKTVNTQLVHCLTILGQPAYGLVDNPGFLVLSLLLLEHITKEPTLFGNNVDTEITLPNVSSTETPSLLAIAHWWRARALLTHLSIIPEPSGNHPAVASKILSSIDLVHAITKSLPQNVSESFKRQLYTIFYLENIKCSLTINTEHLCLPTLTKVQKLTNFQFVLTGARAKRTKFQQVTHAGLIILAKSSEDSYFDTNDQSTITPESFELNSDLLLEKPHFDSIGSEPLDEQIIKRQKLDENSGIENDKLLPIALRQEYIPTQLQELDPNNQPHLSNYDTLQLLLRLYTIKKTTPARDALVEEELASLLTRIIYQEGANNWTIFSRALWERSILETNKAKTVERGLLQMQSLVEELGLKIQTRLIPEAKDKESNSPLPRLKYIHQLPFIPRWELDASLAEKYMSMGILKSAVEIYERLHMYCETALCYAAVGQEAEAERILSDRIKSNTRDARALSILGDLRQDSTLWEKSWDIGRYVNAKNSLAKYYYNPPKDSGLTRDYDIVLKHLNDSLRQYSLNFNTWYFYGCVALECERMEVAAEAFSRCVALDDSHAMSWSNLSAAYVHQGKLKEAFSCLKRASASDSQKNWRIWENYMIVTAKLHEWNDVLLACKQLVQIKRDKSGEGSIDLPVVEKLVEILVSSNYDPEESNLSYFQRSCIEFVCITIPSVVTTSGRAWRLVARVELWRKRPWASLDCQEKAYRAVSHNPDLEINEKIWNETVVACEDLVAAYESLGEMEGKYGPGSLVCKDWKYKARSTIKSLMSKGKNTWEGSDGWERLLEIRKQI